MDCADYRLYCDDDSDSDGNDLMHGVLDKKSVLEFDSRTLCCWWIELLFYLELVFFYLRLRRLPPFTFSNSSIVRACALISFCCTIIFNFFNVYTVD